MIVNIIILILFIFIVLCLLCNRIVVVNSMTQRLVSVMLMPNHPNGNEENKSEDDLPPYSPPTLIKTQTETIDLPPPYDESFDTIEAGISYDSLSYMANNYDSNVNINSSDNINMLAINVVNTDNSDTMNNNVRISTTNICSNASGIPEIVIDPSCTST